MELEEKIEDKQFVYIVHEYLELIDDFSIVGVYKNLALAEEKKSDLKKEHLGTRNECSIELWEVITTAF